MPKARPERLKTHAYDLVLLDVNMPELDGIAAAREICRRQPDPALRPKLVAVTANVLAGDRERCLAAGMDAYLSKPVVPRALVACLETLFGSGSPAPTPPPPPPVAADPWIDVDQLQQLVEGLDATEARLLLEGLQQSGRVDYVALRPSLVAALAGRRPKELEKLVHGLKGCAASVGWKRMALHCGQALATLRANRFQQWNALAPELQALFEGSESEWQRLAPQFGPAPSSPRAAAIPLGAPL